MSRHPLDPRDEETGYEIAVGWDAQMGTFFGQVFDRDGEILVDRGDLLDRINNPGVVLDALRDYAVIPLGMEIDLLRDALADTPSLTTGEPHSAQDIAAHSAESVTAHEGTGFAASAPDDELDDQAADYHSSDGLSH